jgi:hypothetical protein
MEQSPSSETNNYSASQEMPSLLWNLKVHYHVQKSPTIPTLCVTFCNKLVFNSKKLLAPHQTKLEDHPLSAFHDSLFNVFGATLRIWTPSPSSATQGCTTLWWQVYYSYIYCTILQCKMSISLSVHTNLRSMNSERLDIMSTESDSKHINNSTNYLSPR